MKIKLDLGATMPTRAHETDAGLDLYSTEDKIIYPRHVIVYIRQDIGYWLGAMKETIRVVGNIHDSPDVLTEKRD